MFSEVIFVSDDFLLLKFFLKFFNVFNYFISGAGILKVLGPDPENLSMKPSSRKFNYLSDLKLLI